MTDQPISVDFTTAFKRNLRTLAKKYRHIRADVKPLIEQLQAGETPGDQVPGIALMIYKVRVRNSDLQRGKSGGYRVIYYLKNDTQITLVTIYSKTEQADVTIKDVRDFLDEYFESGAAALDL